MTTPGVPAPPPDDLPALRAWLAAQDDADLMADLPIREIVVRADERGGVRGLPVALDAPHGVLLVRGDTPYLRAGQSLKPLVHDLLAEHGRQVEILTLPA